MMITSTCTQCQKEYQHTKSSKGLFCSRACYGASLVGKSHNNFKNRIIKKSLFICDYCGSEIIETNGHSRRYCSSKCMGQHTRATALNKWLDDGVATLGMKDYVLKEQDYRCSICDSPSEWNGKPMMLIMDHIDGNSENNWRSNLRCVCPNCDSQLETYKSKNRGNGRHARRIRYAEGKSF